jgi:hypothetical protein
MHFGAKREVEGKSQPSNTMAVKYYEAIVMESVGSIIDSKEKLELLFYFCCSSFFSFL